MCIFIVLRSYLLLILLVIIEIKGTNAADNRNQNVLKSSLTRPSGVVTSTNAHDMKIHQTNTNTQQYHRPSQVVPIVHADSRTTTSQANLNAIRERTAHTSMNVEAMKKLHEASLSTLKDRLKRASGVYNNNEALVKKYHLEKTVFVTAANYGFLNHLLNFFCYVQRLEMKVLVVSLDAKLDQYLNTHNSSQIISFHMEAEHGVGRVNSDAALFRTKQFNLMSERKKEIVYDILKLGYNVMFADTDVAMLEDPFPYLLWENMDYVHSLNMFCTKNDTWATFTDDKQAEGNTGYYYIQSNPRTIKLLEDFLVEMDNNKKDLDDQTIFWNMLRERKEPPVLFSGKCANLRPPVNGSKSENMLTTCVLDPCVFSSGMMRGPEEFGTLLNVTKERNQKIVTIHANWLNGNHLKEGAMTQYGYWLPTSRTALGQCKEPPSLA